MSQKAKDNKNRWRSKTVGFRVSPEEWEQVTIMAYASGLQKQEYLIKRVLQQDIIVQPSPRVQKALRILLERVAEELRRLEVFSSDNDELLETIRYLTTIIDRMGYETKAKEKSPYTAR